MDDARRRELSEQLGGGLAVGEVVSPEVEAGPVGELGEPRPLQRGIVVRGEAVDPDDGADKPYRARASEAATLPR